MRTRTDTKNVNARSPIIWWENFLWEKLLFMHQRFWEKPEFFYLFLWGSCARPWDSLSREVRDFVLCIRYFAREVRSSTFKRRVFFNLYLWEPVYKKFAVVVGTFQSQVSQKRTSRAPRSKLFFLLTRAIVWDWPLGVSFYGWMFSTGTWPFSFLTFSLASK